MKTNYKKGKLCLGLGEQEEYLSEFQFKGTNKLKGIWIVQDWKNEFYQHTHTIARGINKSTGTSFFKKISFVERTNMRTRERYTQRVLSNQLYRLGIKRTKAFSINHNKEISFVPLDISEQECDKWYNCEFEKDCVNCANYFDLKTVKKINFRYKIKDILQLSSSKKRLKVKMNVEKTHYLVRGFSMTKLSDKKKERKEYPNAKLSEPLIYYQNQFIKFEEYEKIQAEVQKNYDQIIDRSRY